MKSNFSNFLLLDSDKAEIIVFWPAFFHLCSITNIRNILSKSDAEKVVQTILSLGWTPVTVLSECPKNILKGLQLVHYTTQHNTKARVQTGVCKWEHISPVWALFYWLPVGYRIDLNILLLTYKALNDRGSVVSKRPHSSTVIVQVDQFQPLNVELLSLKTDWGRAISSSTMEEALSMGQRNRRSLYLWVQA